MFMRGHLRATGWFLFDSGNLGATRVAPHMVAPGVAVPSRIESAVLSLDGLPARTAPVSVGEIIYDGVLSEALLREWVWTFRLAGGDVWAGRLR